MQKFNMMCLLFVIAAGVLTGCSSSDETEKEVGSDVSQKMTGQSKDATEPNARDMYDTEIVDMATTMQLTDKEYQSIITPTKLKEKIETNDGVTYGYFFSPTCGFCQETTPRVNEAAKNSGVTIDQYNVLVYPQGWDEYGVTGTPTLIAFYDGKEIGRVVGSVDTELLEDFMADTAKKAGSADNR